jgi:hypothetical protein
MHPIGKKMFGPDKVHIVTDYNIHFISPKLFIVEEISNSTGFKFCDYFSSYAQWRFSCEYKFDYKENVFKFNTKVTVGFQTHFFKSCLFKTLIESESAKESEEHIKYSVIEKMKFVLDKDMGIFIEILKKITEENIGFLNILYEDDINDNEDDLNENDLNDNHLNKIDVVNFENNNIENNLNSGSDIIKGENNKNNNEENKEIEFIEIFGLIKIEKEKFFRNFIYISMGFIIMLNLNAMISDSFNNYSIDKITNTILILIVIFIIYNKK